MPSPFCTSIRSVSRAAPPSRAPPLRVPRALAFRRCRLRIGRAGGRAPTMPLRAWCGGAAEPVEARKDGAVLWEGIPEDAGLAPEVLELLEDEAIGGGDDGRLPTDYDRRAHIFEASSRVFLALKQRRECDDDGDGDGHEDLKAGAASAAIAATAETTRDRHEQHRLE